MEHQKTVDVTVSSMGDLETEGKKISDLLDGFLDYGQYEVNFSPQTVKKYKESLG